MYDVGCTMYDCQICARGAEGRWQLTLPMYDGGRQGLPMYEVRCTKHDLGSERALRGTVALGAPMYDGGRQGLPMYEVRCTMYDLGSERALRGTEALGSAYVRRRQTEPAYVRCWMYEVNYNFEAG